MLSEYTGICQKWSLSLNTLANQEVDERGYDTGVLSRNSIRTIKNMM